jgi:hypothetical protein
MRWFTVAMVVLSAATCSATETRLVLDYDLSFGPLRLIAMRATVDLDETRYRAATEMHTVGLAGFLFPWESHSHSAGLQAPDGLRPQQYLSEGKFRGQTRRVEIDYGANGALTSHVEPPPELDWRDEVPQALLDGTIDPLSASLSLSRRECSGTVSVFDGRRRYDLALTDLGNDSLDGRASPNLPATARRCRAVIEALAGFWKTDAQHSEAPTTLEYWIARPTPDSPPVPVYIELTGNRGTLHVQLTSSELPNAGDRTGGRSADPAKPASAVPAAGER